MRIIAYKTVSPEDAFDAVICALNDLPMKKDLVVSLSVDSDPGQEHAIVEPEDIADAEELEITDGDYYVIREY